MRSLRDSGYRPELFFKDSDWTSSKLPVALICPKLVRGGGKDDAYRTFNQVAFLDSVRELDDLQDVWNTRRGIIIANGGDKERLVNSFPGAHTSFSFFNNFMLRKNISVRLKSPNLIVLSVSFTKCSVSEPIRRAFLTILLSSTST
jgi:hypothetical protein